MELNTFKPFLYFFLLFLMGCNEAEVQSNLPNEGIDSTGTGIRVKRNAEGKIISKVPYQDSLKHGVGIQYYPSGKVHLEIPYHKGSKNGIEKYYYENGRLYRATRFVNGLEDSTQVFYHENGKLMAKVPYNEGELCLGTEEYNDQGKKLSTPEIQISVDNTVALDSRAVFNFSVSRRLREIEFFHVADENSMPCPRSMFPIETKKGKSSFEIVLPPGSFMMYEFIIAAQCRSFQRIPHLVVKKVPVSITNRG